MHNEGVRARWNASLLTAETLGAANLPTTGYADRPCPHARAAVPTECACVMRCASLSCKNAHALCKQLSWCATVSINREKTHGTLKAATGGVAKFGYGVEEGIQPVASGRITLLIGEQKSGTTSLHSLIRDSHSRYWKEKARPPGTRGITPLAWAVLSTRAIVTGAAHVRHGALHQRLPTA